MWWKVNTEQFLARQVVQGDCHHFGLAINFDRAEKLKAVFRRTIRFHPFRNAGEFYLRPERVVHFARAERARQSLQDTVLRSPLTGVISRKRVEEGQLVQNGQPVLVISDPKDVWILANIKESYIRDVTVGKVVDITVDAYPDRRFEGKVETIGAAAISEFALFPPTGSFTKVEQRIPVQITVANTDGLLKPGMMVVVGIVKD